VPSALSQLICEMIISLHLPYKKSYSSNRENVVVIQCTSNQTHELEIFSAHLPFIAQDMAQICNQNPNIPAKRSFVAERK